MSFEEYLRQNYDINEPIYVKEVEFENHSQSWVYDKIRSLTNVGILKRFAAGIYYFPKKIFCGYLKLDPDKVIQKKYISDGNVVYGYISGQAFRNLVGLTAKYPTIIDVVSNNETAEVHDVRVGTKKVRARKPRIEVTRENFNVLQLMDLFTTISLNYLGETEQSILKRYINSCGVTKNQVTQLKDFYPADTSRNLFESGVLYEFL